MKWILLLLYVFKYLQNFFRKKTFSQSWHDKRRVTNNLKRRVTSILKRRYNNREIEVRAVFVRARDVPSGPGIRGCDMGCVAVTWGVWMESPG